MADIKAVLFEDGKFQAIGNNGQVVPYGKLYFYDSISGDKVDTYTTSTMQTKNTYPVVLSSSGKGDVYVTDGQFDVTLQDKNGATVWTINNYIPAGGTTPLSPTAVTPTKEEFIGVVGSSIILDGTPLTTVDVHKNGLLLNTSEYALDGKTITFTTPLIVTDEIVVEFSKIISSGINAGIVYDTDEIADLLSIDITYKSVNVKFYANAGDGGGGMFIYDSTADKSKADGGTIIDPDEVLVDQGNGIGNGCWVRQYDGTTNIKWFGGMTLTDIINTDGVKHLDLDGTTATINENTYLKSNLKISNGTIYRDADYRIREHDTINAEIVATADAPSGTSYITLDTASYNDIEIDNYIFIRSTPIVGSIIGMFVADPNTNENWVYNEQLIRVVDKMAGNVIRLEYGIPINFDFLTGAAQIYKRTNITENVTFENVTFENSPSATIPAEGAFVNVRTLPDIEFKNCFFDLKHVSGGIYIDHGRILVTECRFKGSKLLSVFLRDSCPNSVISNNSFSDKEYGDSDVFLQTGNYNVVVSNNTFDGSNVFDPLVVDGEKLIIAIQIDAKVHNCTISNNTIHGYGMGIGTALGARNITIVGNSIKNCFIGGLRLTDGRSFTVTGNTFFNTPVATSAEAGTLSGALAAILNFNSPDTVISANTFEFLNSPTEGLAIDTTGDNVTIKDNKLIGGQASIQVRRGLNCEITGNIISGHTQAQAIKITGVDTHYCAVKDNNIETTGNGISVTDGSECNTIHGNTFSDETVYPILITGTSNAQSIFNNIRHLTAQTSPKTLTNVTIAAPVAPINTSLAANFRIYKVTAGTTSNLVGQGDEWWEFKYFDDGNIFRHFTITTAQVVV